MIHTSKVGPKGQVVIPKDLRDEFRIFPGENVIMEDAEDSIVIKKARRDSAALFASIARAFGKTFRPRQWHFAEEEIEEKFARMQKR
jgi:AbrB family looped-hinge helix DNA binding protein